MADVTGIPNTTVVSSFEELGLETTSCLDFDQEYNTLKEDISNSDSLLRRTLRANGVYELRDMNYNTSFYRFARWDPYHLVEGTKEIVFFTKPDLSILANGSLNTSKESNAAEVTLFKSLYDLGYGKTTLTDLCYKNGIVDKECPFIRILTNRISAPLDVPDIRVDSLETAQNMYGTKLFYPKSSMSSDENIEFSAEFEETNHLEIYYLFKAWDYYRRLCWLGVMRPNINYILNKILCDHIAVYKFILDNDGESILFCCKWTGVYPVSISRNTFGDVPEKGPLKMTVGFKQSGWFEDTDSVVISDFNALVSTWKYSYEAMDIWDPEIQAISGENVSIPYIVQDTSVDSDGYTKYLFRWGK